MNARGLAYDVRAESRAGWHDARRTPHARPWHGRRFGDYSYAAGYATRAAVDRSAAAVALLRPCAECGARRGARCEPSCTAGLL